MLELNIATSILYKIADPPLLTIKTFCKLSIYFCKAKFGYITAEKRLEENIKYLKESRFKPGGGGAGL